MIVKALKMEALHDVASSTGHRLRELDSATSRPGLKRLESEFLGNSDQIISPRAHARQALR